MIINKNYNLIDLIDIDISKNNTNKNFRSICPICYDVDGYAKKSLSIKCDFSVGRCFRCDTIFLNEYNPLRNEFNKSLYKNENREFKLYKLDNINDYYDVNGISKIGKDYLLNRNKLLKIEKYKLRATDSFVIIPFYLDNELIYFQKRFINSLSKLKHYKPPIKYQPFYYINNNSKYLIICEGAFDAFACDNLFNEKYDIIALCGKSISYYQLWLLKQIKVYDFITIFLDETILSINLYNNLKNKFTITPVFDIIKSEGDDPEEILNKKLKLEYL